MTTTNEYYLSTQIFYWLIPIIIFGILYVYTKKEYFLLLVIVFYIVAYPASIRKRTIQTNVLQLSKIDSGKFDVEYNHKKYYLFNPNIIAYQNKYYVIFRQAKIGSSVPAYTLYDNLSVDIFNQKKLTNVSYNNINKISIRNNKGLEDSRLFIFNDNIYTISSKFDTFSKKIAQPYIVNLKTGESRILRYKYTNQKNWAPFEFENRLFFIVHFHPLEIIEVTKEDLIKENPEIECKKIDTKFTKKFQELKGLRNSTVVKYYKDGYYAGFLHTKTVNNMTNLLNISDYYHHKFFVFKPIVMNNTLIIDDIKVSDFFNLHGNGVPKLYYLSGFEILEDSILITYGKKDKESHWLKTKEFENFL